MSLKDPNIVDPALTHPYFVFAEKGCEVEVCSYDGGRVEAELLRHGDRAAGGAGARGMT